MRLQRFLNDDMLLEKVSKKDISAIENSNDVFIGAEFEFMTKFLEEEQDRYDIADQMYQEAVDATYVYQQDLEDWEAEDEEDRGDPPEIPKALIRYDPGYENYSAGEEISEPAEPNLYGTFDVDNSDKDWERCVIQYVNDSSRPFGNNFTVVAQHGYDDSDEWVFEQDGSLGEHGIELKSPILTLKEFMSICPKIFKWIDEIGGYTDDECGFHIHMSLKNVPDLTKNLDLVKLMMFTDEDYIFKFFPDRINNQYTEAMKSKLSDQGISKDDWKIFIDTKKMINKVSENHYHAINWEGLSDDKQHIEFRYMGAQNYHKKWNNIKTIVSQYAYNLDLACNPDSHRKEYARKIQRMINKMEMAKYNLVIWNLESYRNIQFDVPMGKILDKHINKYQKLFNNLKSIYTGSLPSINFDVINYVRDFVRTDLYNDYRRAGGKKFNLKKFMEKLTE